MLYCLGNYLVYTLPWLSTPLTAFLWLKTPLRAPPLVKDTVESLLLIEDTVEMHSERH